jgi:hypothetical protein
MDDVERGVPLMSRGMLRGLAKLRSSGRKGLNEKLCCSRTLPGATGLLGEVGVLLTGYLDV